VKSGLIFAALLASSAHAGNWWLTPDQEAQRALEAGDATRAAQLFTDPQHRAYAEIEAKQYADAARRLEPFEDGESQYNRGNALARAGDLPAALSSYEAALKHAAAGSSLHRDAEHNRDLVAQQLEDRKKSQQQPKNGSGQQGQKGDQQQSQSGQQQGQSGQQQQGQSGQQQQGQSGQQQQGQSGQQQQGQSGQQQQGQSGQQQQGQSGQQQGQSGQQQGPNGDQRQSAGQPEQKAAGEDQKSAQDQGAGQQASDPRDALQGGSNDQHPLSQAQNQGGAEASRAAPQSSSSRRERQPDLPRATPPSEQSLSEDQWLRQIPDDPAGLLRRKFLIEHMMKQGAQL
jgi:Ca-activated chloride channel family protein